MESERGSTIASECRIEWRKILVVGKEDAFSEGIMDYAIHLADRLGYEILSVTIGTDNDLQSPLPSLAHQREIFQMHANCSGEIMRRKAAVRGIRCAHVVRFGDLADVVEDLVRGVKRIEFVVTESEANKEEVARRLTVPVFSVITNQHQTQGGVEMSEAKESGKPIGKLVGYGMLTVAMYAAVFANSGTVMDLFTRGGWYSALPIATVFAFSLAHGAFSSNLWSFFGIEAHKSERIQKSEQKTVQPKKSVQKRPRVSAYVNPFHRL